MIFALVYAFINLLQCLPLIKKDTQTEEANSITAVQLVVGRGNTDRPSHYFKITLRDEVKRVVDVKVLIINHDDEDDEESRADNTFVLVGGPDKFGDYHSGEGKRHFDVWIPRKKLIIVEDGLEVHISFNMSRGDVISSIWTYNARRLPSRG